MTFKTSQRICYVLLTAVLYYIPAMASPREDFERMQKEFQASPADQALREKIIKAAQVLKPPPVIPAEARRFLVRGQTLVKEAKKESDYLDAAAEFEKSIQIAPWLADAYFNAGVCYEQAGRLDQAIANMKLYLLAAPNAPDAAKVQDRVYSIELKGERQQKQKDEESRKQAEQTQKKAQEDTLKKLVGGLWATGSCSTARWDRNEQPRNWVCNLDEYKLGAHWWWIKEENNSNRKDPFIFPGDGTVEVSAGFTDEFPQPKIIGKLKTSYPIDLWDISWECVYKDGTRKQAWLGVNSDGKTSFVLSCSRQYYGDDLNFDPKARYPYVWYNR